jgi:hypothetical protein
MPKLLCAALASLALACSDSTPAATRQRGIDPGSDVPAGGQAKPPAPAPAPPPPAPPSSLGSPFAKLDPGALTRREEDAGGPARADAGSEPVDAAPPRDLASELASALGRPADCLDLQQVVNSGGRTTVVVIAQVMPSGRITRVEASAPGQPASALRCLQDRASAASLRGPVPGAPLGVTATVPIEVVSQPTPR